MSVTLLHGDSLEVLKRLPDKIFRACVTSPPYYGLRDYGTAKWEGGDESCNHLGKPVPTRNGFNERYFGRKSSKGNKQDALREPFKSICEKCGARRVDSQIGLEKTPEEYIARLVAVFREVHRTLADDGTLWVNIGDSYWGGKGQSAHGGTEKQRERFERNESINREYQEIGRYGWTAPKDGKHPVIKPKDLIGIPWMLAFALREDGWYLRSEIIWAKPNPMPESVRDRPTKAHEQIFLFSKSKKYYYDYKAILEPAKYDGRKDTVMKGSKKYANGFSPADGNPQSIAVKGHDRWPSKINGVFARNKRTVWTVMTKPYNGPHFAVFPPDLIRPCILAGSAPGDTILDPFNGVGTTGVVAIEYGRHYYGIDLNKEYLELSRKRLEGIQIVGFE